MYILESVEKENYFVTIIDESSGGMYHHYLSPEEEKTYLKNKDDEIFLIQCVKHANGLED